MRRRSSLMRNYGVNIELVRLKVATRESSGWEELNLI